MTPKHAPLPNRWIPSPAARKWLYGIAVAVVALFTTLGTLSEPVARSILDIVAAVVSIGSLSLAQVNTPTSTPTPPELE